MMDNPNEEVQYMFKVIIVGNCSTGKSNILSRYTKDKFDQYSATTVGVEYATKIVSVGSTRVKLQIWDTVGQERYNSVMKIFFKGASAVLLVYDITQQPSFEKIGNWLQQVKENSKKEIISMLVGNKSDLEDRRAVSKQQAKQYAENQKLSFYEVSAKQGTNIALIFQKIAEQLIEIMAKSQQSISPKKMSRKSSQVDQLSQKLNKIQSIKKLNSSKQVQNIDKESIKIENKQSQKVVLSRQSTEKQKGCCK